MLKGAMDDGQKQNIGDTTLDTPLAIPYKIQHIILAYARIYTSTY